MAITVFFMNLKISSVLFFTIVLIFFSIVLKIMDFTIFFFNLF